MWVPTRVQLADGLTKSSAGVFLRNALTSGTAQLHEKSTKVLRKKQHTSSSKEVREVSVVQKDLEQKDWWQRRHNTGESSPRSITEYVFLQPDYLYSFPRQLRTQLTTSLPVFGDTHT